MDYEQKYKDLVKAVKELQEANPSDEWIQNWVNENVPDLVVSEDERIMKKIIESLNRDKTLTEDEAYDCVAWLEKQGNKPQGKSALEAIHEQKADNANKVEVKPKFKIGDWVVDEDDNSINQIERVTENVTSGKFSYDLVGCGYIGWLKILKYRHTYKPSKEQMDTLLFISSVLKDEQVIVNLEELKTLYNDLKKL